MLVIDISAIIEIRMYRYWILAVHSADIKLLYTCPNDMITMHRFDVYDNYTC